MEATLNQKKSSQKQIDWVKQNYHQRGGRERQLLKYHFGKHPELDSATFYADLEPIERVMKLKEYGFQKKYKKTNQ
jgi:hypothetical protein